MRISDWSSDVCSSDLHRVFLVALLGVADQTDQAIADVVYATGVVEDALGSRIVIQRIDGEVAALGIVLEGAIDVVTQDAAALVARSEMAGVVVIDRKSVV